MIPSMLALARVSICDDLSKELVFYFNTTGSSLIERLRNREIKLMRMTKALTRTCILARRNSELSFNFPKIHSRRKRRSELKQARKCRSPCEIDFSQCRRALFALTI